MIRTNLLGTGIVLGIVLGIGINAYNLTHPETFETHFVYVAEAEEPEVIQIAVEIDWTKERIEEEIRTVFHEEPNTAVAVAKCESGLVADIQSQHTLSYGQEQSFGIFQVHAPDWADDAERLGLHNWRTDPKENIALARYIYEKAGKRWTPWVCWTKNMI